MDDKTPSTISFTGIIMFLITAVLMGFVFANISYSFFAGGQASDPPQEKVDDESTKQIKEFGIVAYLPQGYEKKYSDQTSIFYETESGHLVCFYESLDAPLFMNMPFGVEGFKRTGFTDRSLHELATTFEKGDEVKRIGNIGSKKLAILLTKQNSQTDYFEKHRTNSRTNEKTVVTYCFAPDGRCVVVDAPADEVATILHSAYFDRL